jgi:hypothetical protein
MSQNGVWCGLSNGMWHPRAKWLPILLGHRKRAEITNWRRDLIAKRYRELTGPQRSGDKPGISVARCHKLRGCAKLHPATG